MDKHWETIWPSGHTEGESIFFFVDDVEDNNDDVEREKMSQ